MKKTIFVICLLMAVMLSSCETELAEAPTASVPSGTVASCTLVSLSTSIDKAVIRYTLDGSDPTEDSALYVCSFEIDRNTLLKAAAFKGKRQVSKMAVFDYRIKVPNPVPDIAADSYLYAQTLNLSCVFTGATIHYTTDGSTPSASSDEYSGPIQVAQSMTVKAVALENGCDPSDIVELRFEIGFKYGARGPAGGYVFYDCDADNDSGNADGLVSSECGWRYLEAAPNDMSGHIAFGSYRTKYYGSNLYVNGTTTYDDTCTSTEIGRGKSNTSMLVSIMKGHCYVYSKTCSEFAARACDEYSFGGYDDWFLPSLSELDLVYRNLWASGIGNFKENYVSYMVYWSSSEWETSAGSAWSIDFSDGSQRGNLTRDDLCHVRAIRSFV